MVDVFISYARENQALVRQLAEAVKREGYSVWWDDELPPHRSYGEVITEQIGAAKAAIVVWSETAAASEWVRAEADVARNQKKLIQTSLDGRVPPMPFNQIQCAEIGDWQGEDDHPGWRKVRESLAALVGAGTTDRTAYPMPARPPPPAPPASAPAAPDKWHKLLIGVIAFSVLVVAAVGLLAWMRRAPPPRPQVEPAAVEAPAKAETEDASTPSPEPERAPPPRAAEAQPPSKAAPPPPPRASANLRAMRRYCLGRGRSTPECRRLRAQYGR